MPFQVRVETDTINPFTGRRITTMILTYPQFIHAEFMTHRVFARNASSSRAIPFLKLLEQIELDPVIPIKFGANQKGMQTGSSVGNVTACEATWLNARDAAVAYARELHDLGVHKSLPNRIIEPFTWITVIATATEFANFFRLRYHPDAEVHFQKLALMMYEAIKDSEPVEQVIHAPFITAEEYAEFDLADKEADRERIDFWAKVSSARCARVSYQTHGAGGVSLDRDIELADRLYNGSGFGHHCYDATTEVLTDSGWKPWPQVTLSDQLYAIHPGTQEGHFELPSRLVGDPYSGELLHFQAQAIDMMVTPNHRCYVSKRISGSGWYDHQILEARELMNCPQRHFNTSMSTETAELPISAAFLGFWLGDGDTDPEYLRFRLTKQRKIDYLYSLGLHVVAQEGNRYKVDDEATRQWIANNCFTEHGLSKHVPEICYKLNKSDREDLREGLQNSDGAISDGRITFSNTDKVIADLYQILLIQSLYSCSQRRVVNPEPNWSDLYECQLTVRRTPEISSRIGKSSVTKVPYNGTVYCATVSTGLLMTRRSGKPIVSGNSPFEHVAFAAEHDEFYGPFKSWRTFRAMHPNENIPGHVDEFDRIIPEKPELTLP